MEPVINATGIDMNDSTNLALYTQLLQFKNFTFLREKLFIDPDGSQQRSLHFLAHAMGLEYEYSRTTRTATITKSNLPDQAAATEGENLDFNDSGFLQPPGKLPDDLCSLPTTMDSHETLADYEIQMANSAEEYSYSFDLRRNPSDGELSLISPIFDCTSGFWDDFDNNKSCHQPPLPATLPIRASTRDTIEGSGQQWTLISDQECFGFSAVSCGHSTMAQNVHGCPFSLDHTFNIDPCGFPQSGNASFVTLGKPPSPLPVNPITESWASGDPSTNYQPGYYDGLHQNDRSHSLRNIKNDNTLLKHQLYQKDTTGPDSLYHCPWEGESPSCNHKPDKLKYSYDNFVDSHLKPYRCNVYDCENKHFPSTASLLQHEREAHAMHIHGEKPFFCNFEGCDRGAPGNGFPRHWNLCDHIKRVHNRSSSPPTGTATPSRGSKKLKNSNGKPTTGKKSPSVHSTASSGYQEIVFDSKSALSSGDRSANSGRSGPMGIVAIAAMKLVKAVGACWKCKFLRKKCKPETPCEECLKNNRSSHWHPIGCKRGTMKTEMYAIKLCPKLTRCHFPEISLLESWQGVNRVNGSLREAIERREQDLMAIFSDMTGHSDEIHDTSGDITIQKHMLSFLPGTRYSPIKKPPPNALAPLNECVLAILWELQENFSSQSILGDGGVDDFVTLIWFASRFQADTESDQLISQSLICLRTCLEAMNANSALSFDRSWHRRCTDIGCKITCLADLDLHLTLYFDELDRVYFNKENQHNKESWSLSVFYSFCIQGIVRRALVNLSSSHLDGRYHNVVKQYLHLAVRLFVASSGNYDPLIQNLSSNPSLLSTDNIVESPNTSYRLAQVAVRRADWESLGIKSSAEYLKKLFEDNGDVLIKETCATACQQEPQQEASHQREYL